MKAEDEGKSGKTNDRRDAPEEEPRRKGDQPPGYLVARTCSAPNKSTCFADRGVAEPGFGLTDFLPCPKRGECLVVYPKNKPSTAS